MPSLTVDQAYKDTRTIVEQISYRMAKTYFVPYDEVLGQAHLIFAESFQSYNPGYKAKFSTWLYNRLVWDLSRWLKYEYRARLHVEVEEAMVGTCTDRHMLIQDLLALVGDEGRMVLNTVLNTPPELAKLISWEQPEGRRNLKNTIRDYITALGWAVSEVNRGFDEIRFALSNQDAPIKRKPKTDKVLRRCGLTKAKVWRMTRQYR